MPQTDTAKHKQRWMQQVGVCVGVHVAVLTSLAAIQVAIVW